MLSKYIQKGYSQELSLLHFMFHKPDFFQTFCTNLSSLHKIQKFSFDTEGLNKFINFFEYLINGIIVDNKKKTIRINSSFFDSVELELSYLENPNNLITEFADFYLSLLKYAHECKQSREKEGIRYASIQWADTPLPNFQKASEILKDIKLTTAFSSKDQAGLISPKVELFDVSKSKNENKNNNNDNTDDLKQYIKILEQKVKKLEEITNKQSKTISKLMDEKNEQSTKINTLLTKLTKVELLLNSAQKENEVIH